MVSCAPISATKGTGPATSATASTAPPTAGGAPLSSAGTSDRGGGGNLPTAKALSAEEILGVIKNIKITMEPVLFRLEAYGITHDQALKVFKEAGYPEPELSAKRLLSVLAKMFGGREPAVYPLFRKLRFVGVVDGPCHDLQNGDRDGSAFNSDPNEICLSVPRLQKKVDHLSELSEILALAIHEISHRVGATEEEAQSIQFVILKQFGASTPESFNSAFLSAFYNTPTVWGFTSPNAFLEKSSASIPALCAEIGENWAKLRSVMERKSADANTIGIMTERADAFRALKAAVLQSEFLHGFCDNDYQGSYEQTLIDRKIDPKKPFPISVLNEWGENSPLTLKPEDGQLTFVKPGDCEAASFIYKEIRKSMDRYFDLTAAMSRSMQMPDKLSKH